MPSGIVVQHNHVSAEFYGVVRSDITAIVGFFDARNWPDGKDKGGFIQIRVKNLFSFEQDKHYQIFDRVTKNAVQKFFQNGGLEVEIFGICIENSTDLITPLALEDTLIDFWDYLRSEEDIALIYVPIAAYLPTEITKKGRIFADCEALYSFFLRHCFEMNNRFLIMDAPQRLHDDLLIDWVQQFRDRNLEYASYGAVYYPWLCSGEDVFPPGGVIAGMFVRVEKSHPPLGIQWPPANVVLQGVTHLDIELFWDESQYYIENSINPIILQKSKGVMVFGARTLSQDPIVRFINSRRILNLIMEQIRRDSEWAVFEVNNPHLWSVLSRDIKYRLNTFWEAGLLTMSNNGSKYQVLCSQANNPQESRDQGYVNVGIRLQPVGSTEQIQIDLNLGAR